MTPRIAVWFFVGFAVACGWVVFLMYVGPTTMLPLEHGRYFWTVADITAPVALLRHTYPLKYYWYWVVVVNAFTYALVGLVFELVRRTSMRRFSANGTQGIAKSKR